jgi:hypothetical protein
VAVVGLAALLDTTPNDVVNRVVIVLDRVQGVGS